MKVSAHENDSLGSAADERALARRLGVSVEAVQLTRAAELIDLHIDTFILPRISRYDVFKRHAGGPFGRRFVGHVDVPRLRDGGLDGAMWSITTNPFRRAAARWRTFLANLAAIRALFARSGGVLREARTLREYRDVRRQGAHACLLAIQGLNAVEAAPDGVASLPDDGIVRATLVHLTDAVYGATSSPLGRGRDRGLTAAGRAAVAALNARRMFVDLAHIHERAFWDAVAVHDRTQPLIATHTGVSGVHAHWRNLGDAQVKAIADTGGVVGIIFDEDFLRRDGGPRDGAMVVEHLAHVMHVGGEDAAAIGSDFDGMITPPADVASADAYPRLVQHMLDARFSEARIRKILGENFLRAFGMLRPG